MSPATFWHLTPSEFTLLLEGRRRSEHIAWEHTVYVASAIANAFSKRRVRPRDLLPTFGKYNRSAAVAEAPTTRDEMLAMAAAHKAKFWMRLEQHDERRHGAPEN